MNYTAEYRELTKLGLPVMATQLGIITVAFADTAMVGAYGVDELAASAFVNSLFMVPIVMQIGFASGITPLVGALYGRDDRIGAGRMLRAGLQVNAWLSIVMVAVMGAAYFFLDHFGQPAELLPLIRQYYLIILASIFPMAIFNCAQQTSNAVTDTATPMWIILTANVINIFGNWLLIFGHWGCPELGLNGAGLSTLVSRILCPIAIFGVFFLSRRYRTYKEGLLDGYRVPGMRRSVWKVSWPLMIQAGIECGLWSLGAVVTGWFGKIQLAAYQVINTISQLGFMIYMSFGIAVSIRSANFTGTHDMEGVKRTTMAGLHITLVLAAMASLLFLFGGKHLIHFFSPDEEVIQSAMTLLLPLVLYQFGDAVQLTFANGLKGTGNAKPFVWVALVAYVVIGCSALFWLAVGLNMGNLGAFYSFSFALFSAALMLYLFFRNTIRNFKTYRS